MAPAFHDPLLVCGRRFWKLSALIAWERVAGEGRGVTDGTPKTLGARRCIS